MTDIVELNFSLICECDAECCDDVAEDICHDMIHIYSNRGDIYEWLYRGFKIIEKSEDRTIQS